MFLLDLGQKITIQVLTVVQLHLRSRGFLIWWIVFRVNSIDISFKQSFSEYKQLLFIICYATESVTVKKNPNILVNVTPSSVVDKNRS